MNKKLLLASAVSAGLLVSGCSSTEQNRANNDSFPPEICAFVGGGVGAAVAAGIDMSGGGGLATAMSAAILGAAICFDDDKDSDGVINSADKCPGTPIGDQVDAQGCSIVVEEIANEVIEEDVFFVPSQCKNYVQAIDGRVVGFTAMKFAFDNYELSRGMKHHMSCVADAMNQQGLTVELQGNTDSSGTERYNNWLGSKRAEAALNYMIETGADAGKLSATSQGESNPRSSNATQEGMADNRRVDFIIK